MKVLLSWLNDYVDLSDLSPEQVAERLTFSGIEVESVTPVGHDYAGLVVGEVRSVRPHPNADRLRLCTVFDGQAEHEVVCGAHNFEAGAKAAFAACGVCLPDGTRLRKARIRGETSNGMLLAEDELALSDDHSGIVLFDGETAPGTALGDLLPGPDVVLDLEITWNRPDCLCMIGIARELAALLKRPLRLPEPPLTEADTPVAERIAVSVEDPAGCPRYTARVLEHVSNVQAPIWLRQRLQRCGVRSLGVLVDVTNYVMLECGQPLHAFDLERLSGERIIVRRARTGEAIETLDGACRRLAPDMLVIADAERPVAVAGVMGGAASEVGPQTRSVLLESATFNAPDIKQAAYELGMQTESAHRFERGVDTECADWASRRAAGLMSELAGGRILRGVVDVREAPAPPREVAMRFERARRVTGLDLGKAEMASILESLGLEIRKRDDTSCRLRIPSFRPDLEIEADLIEEVARLHGLSELPSLEPAAPVISTLDDTAFRTEQRCRERLSGLGFSEAMHYSFTSGSVLAPWDAKAGQRQVALPNPVSADMSVLRFSLLPQLVETLGRNHARQVPSLALFEIGRIFERSDSGVILEAQHLGLGLFGPVGRDALDRRRPVEPDEAFFWIKGALEAFCEGQGGGVDLVLEDADLPVFRKGYAARLVMDGRNGGVLGLVDPALLHRYRLHAPMAVAELELALLCRHDHAPRALRLPPAFPGVVRDISLVVDESVTHAKIVGRMRGAAPVELTSVTLFDSFSAEEMGAGKRCLAYSLEYRSDARTLTDESVNRLHEPVLAALRSDPGIEIRDR